MIQRSHPGGRQKNDCAERCFLGRPSTCCSGLSIESIVDCTTDPAYWQATLTSSCQRHSFPPPPSRQREIGHQSVIALAATCTQPIRRDEHRISHADVASSTCRGVESVRDGLLRDVHSAVARRWHHRSRSILASASRHAGAVPQCHPSISDRLPRIHWRVLRSVEWTIAIARTLLSAAFDRRCRSAEQFAHARRSMRGIAVSRPSGCAWPSERMTHR